MKDNFKSVEMTIETIKDAIDNLYLDAQRDCDQRETDFYIGYLQAMHNVRRLLYDKATWDWRWKQILASADIPDEELDNEIE